ncbi:MAG: hypothetical protein LBK58_00060 [Prevotellaceae bacterium]|nr:hypothetical protein [Prevotellaceae bacterium]
MMCRVIFYLLISVLISAPPATAAARVKAGSETMKRMFADAQARGLLVERAGVRDLGALCPGKQLRVEMADSTLLDMGLILFPQTMDRDFARPVYGFVERYLLALLLKRDLAEQRYLLREDFVTLNVNGRNFLDGKRSLSLILQPIDSLSPFTLTGDSSHFRIRWALENEDVELSFPKQYDLILGRDKKELAEGFRKELETFVCPETGREMSADNAGSAWLPFTYIQAWDIREEIDDTYLIPQMRSGRFLYRTGTGYEYVFHKDMGAESLLNLFANADEMKRKNKLQLTVMGYRLADEFSLETNCLCAYMKAQKCKVYVGLETATDKEFTGTVMYVNRDLMYKHLLYFKFPTEAFLQDDIPVVVTLYPYIPIRNIATLYEDRNEHQ